MKRFRRTPFRLCHEPLESRQLLAGDASISEFMASNDRTVDDGDGNSPDWIEIHNSGNDALNLAGWHLTDDPEILDKWTFPEQQIGPGQSLIVFASGQNTEHYVDMAGNLHTNFRLSKSGEYLALIDKNLQVAHEFAPAFPPQFVDVSFGTQNGNLVYFDVPTPGEPNSVGLSSVITAEVAFSRDAGTFTDSFRLVLTADTEEGAIYYTTDGSVPTASSQLYSEPITVDGTIQVRARVAQDGAVPGPIGTQSYVRLGADVMEFSSDLPIMVIDNLGAGPIPNKGWNSTGSGIRAVPRQPAHVMLFDADEGRSNLVQPVSQDSRIGIRVRGAFSSSWPEPGYSMETWSDGIDDDADMEILGMTAASNWVLYGPNPTQDKSLIQNTFLFELSNQMGRWATDFQYVQAFVNTDGGDLTMSDFVGLYVIEERVERAPHRLEFEPFASDASSGGWMLEINRLDAISLDGEPPKNFHTAGPDGILQTPRDLQGGASRGDDIPRQQNAYINFADPNGFEINSVQRDAIEGWMQQMEDVLYGRTEVAWNDPVDGYAKYIDVDGFVDYFILQNLPKTGDGLLISMWLYNPDPNNGGKLTFGPIWDNDFDTYTGNPAGNLRHRADRLWYRQLFRDPDFTQRYIDRWQALRDGPLSSANMSKIMDDLFARIGNEAAVNDGISDWPTRQEAMREWVLQRAAAIDQTFVARPEFNTRETVVPRDFSLTVENTEGTAYYTVDGSDPRLHGGGLAPQAIEYQGPINISKDTTISARRLVGDEWSGLTRTDFLIASELPLAITEINYQPYVPGEGEPDAAGQLEFVELTNTGSRTIDLAGVRLVETDVAGRAEGISFAFASQALQPGERIVVASDRDALHSRYGAAVRIAEGTGGEGAAGVFSGELSDRGEQLTLLDAAGQAISQFQYRAVSPWPDRAAGRGSSLEIIDTQGNYNQPSNWRASSQFGGSPGATDESRDGEIVITEVLASPDVGQEPLIELHNTTSQDIDVSHWYLGTSPRNPTQTRVAPQTVVPAGGYLVLSADALGVPLDGTRRGQLLLSAANEDGRPLSFVDHVHLDISDVGTSVGSQAASDRLVPLQSTTFGAPNAGPALGEVMISEVHYAPVDLDGPGLTRERDFAFLELYNRSTQTVDLEGWQLSGEVEMTFEAGTRIEPGQALTVVRFNTTRGLAGSTFRFLFEIPLDTTLVGNHRDTMDRESGAIQLARPRRGPADNRGPAVMITVDRIEYASQSPWPESAGGSGDSLHRSRPDDLSGLAASSWFAAPPSPGTAMFAERTAGDSNMDGEFNQLDIALTLQSAKYDTREAATFSEGDWNGDGFFDRLDIVFALQAGTYAPGQ